MVKKLDFGSLMLPKTNTLQKRRVLKPFYLLKTIFSGTVDLDVIDVWQSQHSLFPNPSAVPELQFRAGGILGIVDRAVQPCVTAEKPANRKMQRQRCILAPKSIF